MRWFVEQAKKLAGFLNPLEMCGPCTDSETSSSPDLSTLTVAQLKDLAKARNLKGYTGLRKDALVEFIKHN
jgi:hypothetical protein